jgi:hypothetical protein
VCFLAAYLTERFVCALPRPWWTHARATSRRARYCEPVEPIQAGAKASAQEARGPHTFALTLAPVATKKEEEHDEARYDKRGPHKDN